MNFKYLPLLVRRWFALVFVGAVLLTGAVLAGVMSSSHDARSNEQPNQLALETYVLSQPLTIGTKPLIRLENAIIKFTLGTDEKDRSGILRKLPQNWAWISLKQDIQSLSIDQALITIDLRGKTKTPDVAILLQKALAEQKLSKVKIFNSRLRVLRDMEAPLLIPLKTALFDIDLDDGEIEGNGQIELGGRVTDFILEAEYAPLNGKSPVLTELNFNLKNKAFESAFNGVLGGEKGLSLKGDMELLLRDPAAFGFWVEKPKLDDEVSNEKKPRRLAKTLPVVLSAKGKLSWVGNSGTLSQAKLTFGQNKATGTMSLKLTDHNHKITGTLAFENIDLTPALLKPDPTLKTASTPRFSGLRNQLEHLVNICSPFIRNIDVDLRLSAATMKVGHLSFTEAGFSLFQKNGEVIFDMTDTALFGGQASGHIKINMNSPKPRWHINTRLFDIELGLASKAFTLPSLLEGRGTVGLHLTSFGDKSTELYHNMFGSLKLQLPKGGEIAVSMVPFLATENLGPAAQFSDELGLALQDKTLIESLNITSHFAKGGIVTDHLMLKTVNHDFTAVGLLDLQAGHVKWHLAAWGKTNNKNKITSNDQKAGAVIAPSLLVCSEISGPFDDLRLKRLDASQLLALKQECPAPYEPISLKSHDETIVR